MPGQLSHVLLGRLVAVTVADRHGSHSSVRHLSHRHGELHVGVLFQGLGDLVVRRERHVTGQVVSGVRTCKRDKWLLWGDNKPMVCRWQIWVEDLTIAIYTTEERNCLVPLHLNLSLGRDYFDPFVTLLIRGVLCYRRFSRPFLYTIQPLAELGNLGSSV